MGRREGITESTSKAKNKNEKKWECRVGGNEGRMGISQFGF